MPARSSTVVCQHCGARVRPEMREGRAQCPQCAGDLSAAPRRSIEELLEAAGPYEVRGEIARGGMGVVYRAFDNNLQRDVAIKVLVSGPGAADEDLRRFYREAQAAARLRHTNIVSIHAVGEVAGQPFIVMDYVDGENLADLIEAGVISPRRALDAAEHVADALHYAHLRGVVHRDIKPGNILVDSLGRAQLMDFGLAKRLDERTRVTRTGTTMGTPAYMPPEQAEGKLEEIDAQSDVYSLGAVLYEMLTRQPPFEGENTLAILINVLEQDPPAPRSINPKIHPDIENICLKAMEKSKARRYHSALEMAEDIRRFKRGEAIIARPRGAVRRLADSLRRRLPLVSALASALLAAAITAGYFYAEQRSVAAGDRRTIRARALDDRQRGNDLLAAGQAAEALAVLREARRLVPDLPDVEELLGRAERAVRDQKVQHYLELADRFMREEQFVAAEVMYRLVLDEFDAENARAQAGALAARGVGMLSVTTEPADVDLALVALDAAGRRAEARPLGRSPIKDVEVEQGVYCLLLGPPDAPLQEIPFQQERRGNVAIDVSLPPEGTPFNMLLISAEAASGPLAAPQFYVDRFEYPNRWGVEPLAGVSHIEAQALCRKQGKRLCRLDEWQLACAGPKGQAFPYGVRYRPDACNTGRPLEGRAEPAGLRVGCVSHFGVYDMSGNLAEWVNGGDASTAGGNWSQSLDRNVSCQATRYYEPQRGWESVGFRCCRDVGRPASAGHVED